MRLKSSFGLGLAIGLAIALIFLTGAVTGAAIEQSRSSDVSSSDQNVREFLSAYRLLTQQSYNQHLNRRQLIYAAINGMMSATGDPHTTFLPPSEEQVASAELNGRRYAGIGAIVARQGSSLRIIAPLPDSPSMRAGLRFNDRVTRVNGKLVSSLPGDAIGAIHGKAGTVVRLTVVRGHKRPITIAVKREEIAPITAYAQPLPHRLALLTIYSFGSGTPADVHRALLLPQVQHARGLVIDLRDNPGGYVSAAQQIVSMFVGSGVVAYERSSNGTVQPLNVTGAKPLVHMPIAILVNAGTASAAEITSAALRDDDHAVLIGTQTYGKGSMQSVYTLPDGSSLHITDKLWLTPRKQSIQGTGLTPNKVVVAAGSSGGDVQLHAAEHYLLQRTAR